MSLTTSAFLEPSENEMIDSNVITELVCNNRFRTSASLFVRWWLSHLGPATGSTKWILRNMRQQMSKRLHFASCLKACSPRSRFSGGGSGTSLASMASGSGAIGFGGASSTLDVVGIGIYEGFPFPEAPFSYLYPRAVIAIPFVEGR